MNGVYTDNDKKILEEEKKALEPKKCPRCERINPADALYCNCGLVIDGKEALRIDGLKEEVDNFTEELMHKPIPESVNGSDGSMEALYQMMIADKGNLERFKQLLGKIGRD